MSGYFAVHRSVFEHVDFADEPFTEREAWLWLISEAAWQPKRVRIGGGSVMLERGELAHSLRFLADKWQWSVKRVRGYLDRSEKRGRITRKRAHDGAVLTICNYDKYQLQGHTEGQPEGTARAQQGHKEEELKEVNKIDGDGAAAPTPQEQTRKAIEIVQEIGRLCGFKDATEWPWENPVPRARQWLDGGWKPDIIVESVRAQLARKRDGPPFTINFFEKGIARAHSQVNAPLPEIPSESIQHAAFKRPTPGTDDILAKMREFGA